VSASDRGCHYTKVGWTRPPQSPVPTDQPRVGLTVLPPALRSGIRERLQAGTEDAPVLDRPAPLRNLHDSGAGYKYLDLLIYLLILLRGDRRPRPAYDVVMRQRRQTP